MMLLFGVRTQETGDGWVTLIVPIVFFGLYILLNSLGKKRPVPRQIPPVMHKQEKSPVFHKKTEVKKAKEPTHYPIEQASVVVPSAKKNKKSAFFHKGWNSKSSLQRAFILSEVFRRSE